ncbi:MAG: hypothetical protein JOZ77_11515 [Candidatus Eremiobacteraeota bacterium]|nr:hypothetical protein [Candidatus Eremiobacteraeota bacterium]
MFLSKARATLPICAAFAFLSACSQNQAVPSNPSTSVAPAGSQSQSLRSSSNAASPADTTSILKQDTKNVVIGSTVDPTNGDTGPHSLQIDAFKVNYGKIKKGQLVFCNYADSSGTPGNGTTIDVLNPTPSSSPTRFAQSNDIKGCSGSSVSSNTNFVYGAGMTSGLMTQFTAKGAENATYGPPLQEPFSTLDVSNKKAYSSEYVFTTDVKTGSIVSTIFAASSGGTTYLQGVTGFAVNYPSGTGWNALGPAGLQYYAKKNLLYVADGVTDTIVEITNPNDILLKNEIVVGPSGKTFTCLHKKTTCAKLVYAGSPLNGPVAMTLLHNGNLVVANAAPASGGGNELVELTTTGQVLDTEVVDTGNAPAIFGLASSGTTDANTVIYYTDTNDNTVHELEP